MKKIWYLFFNAQNGVLHHLDVRFDATSARDEHNVAVTHEADDEALENNYQNLYVVANTCELFEEVYVLAYVGLDVETLWRAVESVCDVETDALVLIDDAKWRLANCDLRWRVRWVGSKVHNL